MKLYEVLPQVEFESPTRKDRLQALLQAMEIGTRRPTDDQFKTYLTADEGRNYAYEMRHSKPKVPIMVKHQLRQYLICLAEGDRCYSRVKGRTSQLRAKACRDWRDAAEKAYEKAFVHLEEAIGTSRDILSWLDRNPEPDSTGVVSTSPCPEGMPRLIDSRSPHCLSRDRRHKLQIGTLRFMLKNIG